MNKTKYIKIKNEDSLVGEELYTISADAKNVDIVHKISLII